MAGLDRERPQVLKVIVRVLAGFWLMIGVLLIAYACIGGVWGAYEYFFLDLNNGRLQGSVMILIVAGLLTASSYISVRCIKYYTYE